MSKYTLTHSNGDFEVTMEFEEEDLWNVIMNIKAFLKGCTFSSEIVDEYIPEN